MAYPDVIDKLKTAVAHLNSYMAKQGGAWADYPKPVETDPMILLKEAQASLLEYMARIARVDEVADVILQFDGTRLPVQVEWDEGEAYPSHVWINGKWLDVAETWLSFEPAAASLTEAVRHELHENAKQESGLW